MRDLALVALVLAAPALGGDLVRNPGFEDGTGSPSEWSLGMEGRGAGSATWIEDGPHSGGRCVRLEMAEAGDYWMARQTYAAGSATAGTRYLIGGWYRGTEGVTHPCVYFVEASGRVMSAWETALPAREEWTRFEFMFAAPPGTDRLELQLRAQGVKGVCWFDDVSLTDADERIAEEKRIVAPLLAQASDPDMLWAIVSSGGRAEFELVGCPSAEVSWAVIGGQGCTLRVEPAGGANTSVARAPRNDVLKSRRVALSSGIARIVASVGDESSVMLVGLRVDVQVAESLASVTAQGLPIGALGEPLPASTRVLDESAKLAGGIRERNRDSLLRKALGARPGRAAARVCSAWRSFDGDQWLRWALAGREPEPVPAGARDGCVSLQVLFAPDSRPGALTAHVSDLAGPDGARILASACQVRMLGYVPIDGRWLPDPLFEDQPFEPPQHGPIVFRITVHVPRYAVAGTYRGAIEMRADSGASVVADFGVRVWPITLPEQPRLNSSFWLFRGQINRYFGLTGDVPMEDYYPYIDLAASHRLSPIDVVEGPTGPMVRVFREPDGRLTYDFTQWDEYLDRLALGHANTIHLGFTHWMAHYFSGGSPEVIDRATMQPVALGYAFGSPEHLDALAAYLRAAFEHVRERGCKAMVYIQPWDEPGGEGLAKSTLILKGLADRVPEVPRLMTAVVPGTYGGKFAEAVDLWCPLTPSLPDPDFDAMRQRGDATWAYVCCGPGAPYANLFTNWKVAEMRALFWQLKQQRATGLLYWGLNYWISWDQPVPSPRFPDADWTSNTLSGDGYSIYPGREVNHPLSSIRLETIRDGIEDYDLLCLLEDTVRAHPGADPRDLALAHGVLRIRPQVSKSLTEFDRDGAAIDAEREVIAGLIIRLRGQGDVGMTQGRGTSCKASNMPLLFR